MIALRHTRNIQLFTQNTIDQTDKLKYKNTTVLAALQKSARSETQPKLAELEEAVRKSTDLLEVYYLNLCHYALTNYMKEIRLRLDLKFDQKKPEYTSAFNAVLGEENKVEDKSITSTRRQNIAKVKKTCNMFSAGNIDKLRKWATSFGIRNPELMSKQKLCVALSNRFGVNKPFVVPAMTRADKKTVSDATFYMSSSSAINDLVSSSIMLEPVRLVLSNGQEAIEDRSMWAKYKASQGDDGSGMVMYGKKVKVIREIEDNDLKTKIKMHLLKKWGISAAEFAEWAESRWKRQQASTSSHSVDEGGVTTTAMQRETLRFGM